MQNDDEYEEDYGMEEPEDDLIMYEEPSMKSQTSEGISISHPFKITPINEVLDTLTKSVDKLDQVLNIGPDWCILLLNNCRWNSDRCQDVFLKGLEKMHSLINYQAKPFAFYEENKVCGVCDQKANSFLDIGCGHQFCVNCWKQYVSSSIGMKVVFFNCMRAGCKAPVRHSLILKLLENSPSKLQQYSKYLGEKYVQGNSNMKFCPGTDCNKCIYSKDSSLKDVRCECGTRFCFKCRDPVHRPCECQETRRWRDIVQKEEANAKWLSLNTKVCPFCNRHVERSTGCNFMLCAPPGGCSKSFCYVCSRPWEPDHKDHFKCHIYKEGQNDAKNKDKEKQILQKINFFCEKYLSNQHGATKLQEMVNRAKQMQEDYFELLKLDLIDTEFIPKVYQFAIDACNVLKWSYAFKFFMKEDSPHKDLFDIRQGDFEKFKENLLFKLETKLVKMCQDLKASVKAKQKINFQEKRKEFGEIKQEIQSYYKSAQDFMAVLISSVQNEMM